MALIRNPVLPGFNPDPSICRVGDDYYIATSTFEWFPGVQIHHSRDLVHWRLAARPLERRSQLDLLGCPDSGGIWAPCLTHARGRFWLIFTNVRSLEGAFKDTPNFLVTAERIDGPWSEPVPLNSSGFDPSLFHDDDGRQWLVNQLWDHRPSAPTRFAGIVIQAYDHAAQRLVGEPRLLHRGTALGISEGPHLYRRGGWVYLVLAEGGTSWQHAVSVLRARRLDGPWEEHPDNPILTSLNTSARLQKAGHGSWIEAADGSWWLAHLCSRPVLPGHRCMLGRETALQRLTWGEDGWPRLAHGGRVPAETVPGPDLPPAPWPALPERRIFAGPRLPEEFQTLRQPLADDWAAFVPGGLRLIGRDSPASRFRHSLVARRLQAFRVRIATRVQADPADLQQFAGLTAWYDTRTWFAVHVAWHESVGRCVRVAWSDDGAYGEDAARIALAPGPVELGADLAQGRLRFRFRQDGGAWQPIGPDCDASKLSDDYGKGWHFTGAFVGIMATDLSGRGMPAEFAWFDYAEAPE